VAVFLRFGGGRIQRFDGMPFERGQSVAVVLVTALRARSHRNAPRREVVCACQIPLPSLRSLLSAGEWASHQQHLLESGCYCERRREAWREVGDETGDRYWGTNGKHAPYIPQVPRNGILGEHSYKLTHPYGSGAKYNNTDHYRNTAWAAWRITLGPTILSPNKRGLVPASKRATPQQTSGNNLDIGYSETKKASNWQHFLFVESGFLSC